MNPPTARRRLAPWGMVLMLACLPATTPVQHALARHGDGERGSAKQDGDVIQTTEPNGRPALGPGLSNRSRENRLPLAIARVEGSGTPGGEARLVGGESKGSHLRFRWAQVGGTAVTLDDATGPEARFTVPDAAGPLGFLLVVTGPEGTDVAEVAMAIGGGSSPGEPRALAADAGDDQVGLAGRQVTLNGSRSEPRGRVGFRWIQTGGPGVSLKIEEGYYLSFVPTLPGVYRFALVVATQSRISTPDEIVVRVGSGTFAGAAKDEPAAVESPRARPTVPTQEIARSGLASIRGGPEAAESLAKVFEDTADRMGVYSTYGEAFSEMSRRFEGILPAEPARRQRWLELVFQPLTARTLDVLRPGGLELIRADGQDPAMDDAQKASLAEQFRLIAEGFRSVSPSR